MLGIYLADAGHAAVFQPQATSKYLSSDRHSPVVYLSFACRLLVGFAVTESRGPNLDRQVNDRRIAFRPRNEVEREREQSFTCRLPVFLLLGPFAQKSGTQSDR